MEFSKKLLIADYIILIFLIGAVICTASTDVTTLAVAWVAQVGISSAAYYWKAKNENRVKVPLKVIESLPPELRKDLDLAQIITAIIQAD